MKIVSVVVTCIGAIAIQACAVDSPDQGTEAEPASVMTSESALKAPASAAAPTSTEGDVALCTVTTANGCSCSSPTGSCNKLSAGSITCGFEGLNGARCRVECSDEDDGSGACKCVFVAIYGSTSECRHGASE